MTPDAVERVMRLVAITTVSLVTMVGCQEKELSGGTIDTVRPVKLHTITNDTAQFLRTFPAIVEPHQEANLSFRIAGELVKLSARAGALVEKGDSLAVLDNRDILNELKAQQTEHDLAKSEYQRADRLVQRNMVSPSVFEAAETRLKAAEVSLQKVRNSLTDTTLRAPFSGRVSQTLVDNFQSVEEKQLILNLQDNSKLDINIQLPESLLVRLKEEEIDDNYQPYVSFPENSQVAYPVTYKKHSTQVTSGTQSYEVTFSLPAPDNFIVYPGMSGSLTLDLNKLNSTPQVGDLHVLPVTSVQKDPASGGYRVWVFNPTNQMLSTRSIDVTEITSDGVVVIGEFQEGEKIVSAGLNLLEEGVSVKPINRERGL